MSLSLWPRILLDFYDPDEGALYPVMIVIGLATAIAVIVFVTRVSHRSEQLHRPSATTRKSDIDARIPTKSSK